MVGWGFGRLGPSMDRANVGWMLSRLGPPMGCWLLKEKGQRARLERDGAFSELPGFWQLQRDKREDRKSVV